MSQLPPIKYPIGIQTFSKIIEGEYLYIDKTRLVWQLANSFDYAFLSRPRRFGKSLLISTLQAYFEGRKELFEGLEIERLETKWTQYPVLRFDLSGTSYENSDDFTAKISEYLARFEKKYGVEPEKQIGGRFYNVIEAAYRATGKKVVILIDEYDKPMLDTLHDSPLHETVKARIRGFYSVLKECDEFIKFGMLTGVTKFGKVSIFSGLNNLFDISLMPEYNDICGITEHEFLDRFQPSLEKFAKVNGISCGEAAKRFKAYYDGYHFAENSADIYNPFSTLNAFATNALRGYWFSTGSSNYLINLIKRGNIFLQDIEGQKRTADELMDISDSHLDIAPLFYQAGYLTIKDYDPDTEKYILGLPNREVSKAFWDTLGKHYFRGGINRSQFDLDKFVSDLNHGDADNFMLRVKSLFASISSEHESDKEAHFQSMLTILVKMLGFSVHTEVHSSQGRSDIEIETPNYIYIIELKIDATPQEALAQIQEKGYPRQYEIDPRKKIIIGGNFSTETRTLTEWVCLSVDTRR